MWVFVFRSLPVAISYCDLYFYHQLYDPSEAADTHTHLDVKHWRELVHEIHHVPLFALVLDVRTVKVQLREAVVKVLTFLLDTYDGMNED